jgi:hypothetical protein
MKKILMSFLLITIIITLFSNDSKVWFFFFQEDTINNAYSILRDKEYFLDEIYYRWDERI